MKIFLCLFSIVFTIAVNGPLFAQNYRTSEIVTVDGEKYLLHEVESGETLFSIGKRYGVEQKELVNANPQLIFGLKQGDTLKVPYKPQEQEEPSSEPTHFIYHVVKKSETIYSLSRRYNIPIDNIYFFNPEAESALLENEIIRIPKDYEGEAVDGLLREDNDFYYHKVQEGENAYSLARRYDARVNEIFELNPQIQDQVEIGVIIKIPKFRLLVDESQAAVDGGDFFMHRVETGDTFYSYKRRFNVDREQLIEMNPELNDGLLAGLIIKIPSVQRVEVVPVNRQDFISHHVLSGETLYSISKKYNVEIIDIRSLNPELKVRGLIAGETLWLPRQNQTIAETEKNVDSEVEAQERSTPQAEEADTIFPMKPEVIFEVKEDAKIECFGPGNENDTLRIAMFLPLFYSQNINYNLVKRSDEELAELKERSWSDAAIMNQYFQVVIDSLSGLRDTVLIDSMKVREIRSLYPHSAYFVNFLQGFLIGLNDMERKGVKVQLDLFDSEYERTIIDSIVNNSRLHEADLIIGPVDVRLQKTVADFSYKNQIPMISPLAPEDDLLDKNPFYLQVNPSKEYIIRKTADFIGDAYYDKNFIIMTLGSTTQLKEDDLVDLVRKRFFSSGIYKQQEDILFTEVDFTEGGHLGYWQVKKNLIHDRENVIFIPASEDPNEREALLSRAINSLYVLSEEYNITLVGMSDYPGFASINTSYYHRLKLHYLTANYIDYSDSNVNRFIVQYRKHFYSEPNRFSFRGYDVANFFIGAYHEFGTGFVSCIEHYDGQVLQGDFNFQRVEEFGGLMNHTLYIMNYTPDFEVEVVSKVTEGKLILE
ncbi:PBP1 and LysM peptidoglycan-binding domain-containing protein [Roseimarinus sediminis]|uniref:PBP1 and LysM peptidoglycan-binding domain-containing protein n=1 Tax=Roseimarinus sediminis TaxID=1610899 RepID=UPI003D191D80